MQATAIPGFSVHNLADPSVPVLLSVPHAGRDYPGTLLSNLRLPPASLLRLEDRYADLLARDATAQGVSAIIAHRARAWIDLNRDECDVDVEMVIGLDRRNYPVPSAKQRGGLGLVPRRLSGEGDIWKQPFDAADIQARISDYHRMYHAEIAHTLARMRAKFGIAVLLDLHSMPPLAPKGSGPSSRFVIGDRFGASASSRFAHLLTDHLKRRGYAVALNYPYSGDHILRHHAAVDRNIHALQLEVDRSLYLDAALREPGADIAEISALVAGLVQAIADDVQSQETLVAAE